MQEDGIPVFVAALISAAIIGVFIFAAIIVGVLLLVAFLV